MLLTQNLFGIYKCEPNFSNKHPKGNSNIMLIQMMHSKTFWKSLTRV